MARQGNRGHRYTTPPASEKSSREGTEKFGERVGQCGHQRSWSTRQNEAYSILMEELFNALSLWVKSFIFQARNYWVDGKNHSAQSSHRRGDDGRRKGPNEEVSSCFEYEFLFKKWVLVFEYEFLFEKWQRAIESEV